MVSRQLSWYRRNKEAVAKRTKLRRQRTATKLDDLKSDRGCRKCNETDPVVLVFHHRNPKEKSFGIGSGYYRKWETILEEVEKCDVLCRNCHAREHERL